MEDGTVTLQDLRPQDAGELGGVIPTLFIVPPLYVEVLEVHFQTPTSVEVVMFPFFCNLYSKVHPLPEPFIVNIPLE